MSDGNIPIDIAVRKLLDWLVSRRICSRSWHDSVSVIRQKVGEALNDMPEHPGIKQLLAGANINYFTCLRIVEILKETESNSKNFFGSYGSQRMKDWQQIVRLYEVDSVYLAEAASVVCQNVVYEASGLKKALAKCDAVEVECDKKEEQIRRRAADLKEEFRKECKVLGICGDGSIKKEIVALANNLPTTYVEIAEELKELRSVCEFYSQAVKNTVEGSSIIVGNLQYIIEHGNVTTYEWKFGEKPISVEDVANVFIDDESADNGEAEIDFGDEDQIDFGAGDADEIDFGGDEIDFGAQEIDFGEANVEADIDFENVDMTAISVEGGGLAGGVAKEEEALTILDNRRIRQLIIDELEELLCYVTQRLAEKSNPSGKFSLVTVGETEDWEELGRRVRLVETALARLAEPRLLQLQLIRSSPASVDRTVERLQGKLSLAARVEAGRGEVEQRRGEVREERMKAAQQLVLITEKTKELQKDLEADISKRYNGRRVNIMGVLM